MDKKMELKIGTVIQFNENNRWEGCLGIIEKIDLLDNGDAIYIIQVPIPKSPPIYTHTTLSANDFYWIGMSMLMFTANGEEVEEQ